MAVELTRPDRVVVHSIATHARDDGALRRRPTIGSTAEVVIRGLLVGLGVGVILAGGHTEGLIGVATAGILAIGASIASWQS